MREEAEAYHAELGDIAVEKPEVVGAVQLSGGEMVLRVVQRVKPLEHWTVDVYKRQVCAPRMVAVSRMAAVLSRARGCRCIPFINFFKTGVIGVSISNYGRT